MVGNMTDTKATTSLNPVDAEWAARVRRLAGERDAVILAHNYQRPEIQEVADHVGDSLALARLAASSSASVIVLCGVYFMAETAKILSPERTVLIPDAGAGCSLADSITADQLREWKAEHPGAAVVAYVNTSAEVKAESDVCCTSANAAEVVVRHPRGPRGAVPARPVPRGAREAGDRAVEPARLGRRVPRARGDLAAGAARHGGGAAGGGAVRAPGVRLRDLGAVADGNRRPAVVPHPDPVDRRDARRPRARPARPRSWWRPRPGCCTSCARPTRRFPGSRSTRTRPATT